MDERDSHALAEAVWEWKVHDDRAWADFFVELFVAMAKARVI